MSDLLASTALTPPPFIETPYFDTHFHARTGPVKRAVMPIKAVRVCGGVEEPNTNPHLLTYDDVCRSLDEMHRIAPGRTWKSSIYLTPEPDLRSIQLLHRAGLIGHVKQYPPHGSTHTAESVSPEMLLDRNSSVGKLLSWMAEAGLPIKRHAEVALHCGKAVDPFDREALDLRENQRRIKDMYPMLRFILAHLSTKEGAEHMEEFGDPTSYICELTPHHGYHDRRFAYDGGAFIVDHHCLPVVKELLHLLALQKMFRKKPKWLVAGSDAAAHLTKNKYRFDAFGGLFVYHCDLEMYAQLAAELGVVDYLYDFLYGNAKTFFGDLVPDSPEVFRLEKREWMVTERIHVPEADDSFTPFGYHTDASKRFPFMYQLVH